MLLEVCSVSVWINYKLNWPISVPCLSPGIYLQCEPHTVLGATGSVLGVGLNSRKCDFGFLRAWFRELYPCTWGVLQISKQRCGESVNTRVFVSDFTHDHLHVSASSDTLRTSFRPRLQITAILFRIHNHVLGFPHAYKNFTTSADF